MADAKKTTALLLKHYPEPRLVLQFRNPLELLIAVILSAQCTDARVNAVTATLFKQYRKAKDYAEPDAGACQGSRRLLQEAGGGFSWRGAQGSAGGRAPGAEQRLGVP